MSKFEYTLMFGRATISFLLIVLLAISTVSGMLMNYLLVFLVISAVIMVVTTIVSIVKKQVAWRFAHEKSVYPYVVVGILRNTTWIVTGLCVYIAVIPIQFSSREFTVLVIILWGSVVTLCLLDWIPRKRTGRSFNVALWVFLVLLSFQLVMTYKSPRSASMVKLSPPFKGDWYVIHGGNSALMNHHHFAGSQKYALDYIVPEDGKLPLEQVKELSQYGAFGRTLYSPAEGVVVAVENSLQDQKIGESDRSNPAGNHIVIRTGTDVFLLLAHLQYNSVLVTEGESVMIGQKIARVGNSGNTSQPHLHLHAMTKPDFMDSSSIPLPLSFIVDDANSVFYTRNEVVRGLN